MVHPDCTAANGTIDQGSGPVPYKICGNQFDATTECNTLGGATAETTEFGDMAVKGSRVALQRKLVKYYSDGTESRTSRGEFDVISFDEKGALSLADKQIGMMAQSSFSLVAPVREFLWNYGRRALAESVANRTVLSIVNLDTGDGDGTLALETLAITANTSTALTTNSLTVTNSITSTDMFTMSAAGITLTTDTAQDSTVTVLTTLTKFRTRGDDGDILSVSGVVPGQETVQVNAPVLNLDTRIATPAGNKFGGVLTMATQKTVLQTSTATAEDVAVLTVEDQGKPCAVKLVARPQAYAANVWYTIDFDSTVYGPHPGWADFGVINIPLTLPGGEHFVTFYSGHFGWYGGGMVRHPCCLAPAPRESCCCSRQHMACDCLLSLLVWFPPGRASTNTSRCLPLLH